MPLLYQRNECIIFAEDQGQKVLYNPLDGNFFTVNEVGDFIWNVLEERITIDHLLNKIVENFDIAIEQLNVDIPKYLEQLMDRDLISETIYKD